MLVWFQVLLFELCRLVLLHFYIAVPLCYAAHVPFSCLSTLLAAKFFRSRTMPFMSLLKKCSCLIYNKRLMRRTKKGPRSIPDRPDSPGTCTCYSVPLDLACGTGACCTWLRAKEIPASSLGGKMHTKGNHAQDETKGKNKRTPRQVGSRNGSTEA